MQSRLTSPRSAARRTSAITFKTPDHLLTTELAQTLAYIWSCPGSTAAMLCSTALPATASRSCSEYRTTQLSDRSRGSKMIPRQSVAGDVTLAARSAEDRLQCSSADVQSPQHIDAVVPTVRCLIQDWQHSHILRSATTTLCQPSTTTTFANRAYRCFAPAVWNSLPKTVVNSDFVTVCKSRLKTFLFSRAFSLSFSQ